MLTVKFSDAITSTQAIKASQLIVGTLFRASLVTGGIRRVYLRTSTGVVDLQSPARTYLLEQGFCEFEEVDGDLTVRPRTTAK